MSTLSAYYSCRHYAPAMLALACNSPEDEACADVGTAVVRNVDDASRIFSRTCVQGDVRVIAFAPDPKVLGSFEEIRGSLSFEHTAGGSVRLDSLRSVGGHLSVTGTTVDAVDLPALESVGGGVLFAKNAQILSIELPSLVTVGGDVSFIENEHLGFFDLGSAQVSGSLNITATRLEEVSLQGVRFAAGATITQNAELQLLEGLHAGLSASEAIVYVGENPHLTRISGMPGAELAVLSVVRNDKLEEIAGMQDYRISLNLFIMQNAALSSLAGSSLSASPDAIFIVANPSLARSQIDGFLSDIDGEFVKLDGNLGDKVPHSGLCPWTGDFQCDEQPSAAWPTATGLCLDDIDCE